LRRILNAKDRELAEKLQEDLRMVLQELKSSSQIQESLNRREIKLDLNKLPFAEGATFNCYGDDHITCDPTNPNP